MCQIYVICWTLWCYDKSLAARKEFEAFKMLQFLSVAQYNGYLKALWIILYCEWIIIRIISKKKKKDNLYKIVVIFFEGVQDHL